MNQIPNNVIRQILLLMIILLLGVVLFLELKSFIPGLLGAYTMYVIFRKWMFILADKRKWNKNLAAAVLMLLSFVIVLLPIFALINMLSSKIAFAVNHSSEVLASIQRFVQHFELRWGFDILTTENTQKLTALVGNNLSHILGATFDTVSTIAIMYFLLFFMLTEGRKMESSFTRWMPLKEENIIMLRKDLNSMVYSNAIGIPLIALLQGIVGLVGYLILGVDEPLFWFVITCITAMLPIVGAALAYVPIALLFFANGMTAKGFILLAYGFGVIGTVDNFFRFWLQKKIGDVHPLITVFGVIVGIGLFGFIGLIFGPILIALFILLVRIYLNEFKTIRPSSN